MTRLVPFGVIHDNVYRRHCNKKARARVKSKMAQASRKRNRR